MRTAMILYDDFLHNQGLSLYDSSDDDENDLHAQQQPAEQGRYAVGECEKAT
jgi:hypothetical protein